MSVTAFWYGRALMKALNKEINWASDTIRVMLCTSTYTPNQHTHEYKSSVTNEVTGTGYTAGGAALGSKTMTYDQANKRITLNAGEVVWPNSSITARYAVIYNATPTTDATRPVLGYVDFGQNMTSSNGDFKITWNANGIFTITVS